MKEIKINHSVFLIDEGNRPLFMLEEQLIRDYHVCARIAMTMEDAIACGLVQRTQAGRLALTPGAWIGAGSLPNTTPKSDPDNVSSSSG